MNAAAATLAEFLLARIAEDEDYARAAASASAREWLPRSYRVVTDELFEVGELAVPTSAHVARHDPARTLAECGAKRHIAEYVGHIAADPTLPSTHLARHVLCDLASVYADHPDYRDEWRP